MTQPNFSLSKPTVRMRFGSGSSTPLGIMTILWKTPRGIVPIKAHVAKNDVPLLIGLDCLEESDLYLRNTASHLVSENGVTLPAEKASWHHWIREGLVFSASSHLFHSKAQLSKLHRHFRHPGQGRFYDLLRRTKAKDLEHGTLQMLK